MMAILGGFDGGMGLRFLFLDGQPFLAGLAAAVVLFEVCFVGYLLDSDEPWMRPKEVNTDSLRYYRVRYLATTVVVLTVLAIGLATAGSSGGFPIRFVLGLIAGVAVVAALSRVLGDWIDRRYSATALPVLRGLQASAKSDTLTGGVFKVVSLVVKPPSEPQLYSIHLRGAIVGGLFGLVYVLLVLTRPEWVTAAVAICVLLGLVAAFYGYLRFHFPQRFFGVFLLLVIVVTLRIGFPTYLHRFPGFTADNYENPTPLEDAENPNPNLLADGETLLKWKEVADKRSPTGDSDESDLSKLPKLIVVSTSGGGIRAGVWTADVLTTIEERIEDFPDHLRLVTGASGGMYGASYYVQTLNPPDSAEPHQVPLDQIVSRIAEDSLHAVARELALGDVPHYLLGATEAIGKQDRGSALELAWQRHTQGSDDDPPEGFAVPFSSLADGEREGWRPSLIVSPMMSDDGRRLLFSNLNLGKLTRAKGSVIGSDSDVYSVSAIEFFKLFPDVDLKLATAVRMNASFPYISPDGTLPTQPVRRIVDAGYYDNFGVSVASAWLFHWRDWLARHTSGVLLIQIRDSRTEVQRRHPEATESKVNGSISRGLSWLTTPLTAVMSARNSTNSFRNDEQLQSLQNVLQASRNRAWQKTRQGQPLAAAELADIRNFFVTTAFELDRSVSLSWTLTKDEIQEIKDSAERIEIEDRIAEIERWLHKD
tara:strand:+ start:65003 stop:67126 length:2124 start_codon:yes stop_codon:yes gene_type:complete